MKQKLMALVKVVISLVVLLLLLGLVVETVHTPPANAAVFVDDNAREFITPPFLAQHPELTARFQRHLTYGEARAGSYASEATCGEAECWSQVGRSWTGRFLELIGLLSPLRSRWNADGSWNW